MINFLVYNDIGQIMWTGGCPDTAFEKQDLPPGFSIIAYDGSLNALTGYVDNGEVIARSAFGLSINKTTIQADDNDAISITNIPIGTTVTWYDNSRYIIDDGSLHITTDMVGDYTIALNNLHYLTETINFEAIN